MTISDTTTLKPGDLLFKRTQNFVHKFNTSGGSVGLVGVSEIVMIVGDAPNADYFLILCKEKVVYISKEICRNNFVLLT